MSEFQKELLRMQMELKRWQLHRETAEDMCDQIAKRIEEFEAKVEEDKSLAV